MNPPKGLLEKILKHIHRQERILVVRRIIIFSVMLLASLFELAPSFKTLLFDFNKSGFMSFLSLAFTDFSSIIAHWQSFAMILLETVPAISIVLFLAVLLIFLESLRYLVKNVRVISLNNKPLIA